MGVPAVITIRRHSYTKGENYAFNPGVELPLMAGWDWGSYFSCPKAVSTADFHSGSKSMVYTPNRTDVSQGAVCMNQRIVNAGIPHVVGAWLKAPAGILMSLGGRSVLANGTSTIENAGRFDFTTTGSWQQVQSLSFTVPTPRVIGLQLITISGQPAALGINIYIDDIFIGLA